MRLTQEYTLDIEDRFKYATIVVAVFLLIVISRLFYLQIIKGRFYHFFSTENSIKEIKFSAPRGMIFDRRGQLLVENRPSFNVVIIPQYVTNPTNTFETLGKLLGMTQSELDVAWSKSKTQSPYQPLLVKSDATKDEVSRILARKNPWAEDASQDELRGVDVDVSFKRIYPDGNIASHLLGYVREIDNEKLKTFREKYPGRYRVGDLIGVSGLEEQWDLLLRGIDGFDQRIVNAVGREVNYEGIASQLEKRDALAGVNLKLTIDRDLQKVARDSFGEKKGAAVVVDVNTGALLVLYSAPSFDPNKLAGADATKYWQELSADKGKAMLNRAISGGYPPGSTYKVVNAVASLAAGVIEPNETLNCGGALVYGGRPYHCWRKGGHGAISLHRAIASSCDVYFYMTGLRLGVDRLAAYANMFGLGRLTNVPLTGERSGLIPTSQWKLKRFDVPWQEGETLSISVGQGYDVATPIQNAFMVAMIANGGRQLQPHFVAEATDINGKEVYKWSEPSGLVTIPVDKEILETVRRAMVDTVASPEGTAHAQFTRKMTMGGKTGTAQTIQLDSGVKCSGEKCRDHAWFIAFAPADKPQIAAAVIVENGGFGASAAAPIVGNLVDKYYEIEKAKE